MKKLLPIIIVAILMVGGGAFYGGMKYAESKNSQRGLSAWANLQNLSSEERQQRLQELGGSGALGERVGGGQFNSEAGSRSLSGEVISLSEGILTIKLGDGSTKIVFVSESTQITKSVGGSLTDLNEGERVLVSGKESSDGSYTAKTIQIPSRYIIPGNGE